MSADKIRFGLVGAGAIAHSYGQAFETSEHATLVSVADTRADACSAFAERFDCAPHVSLDDMLRNNHLDAAIVATPPATHEGIVAQLLDHGLPVLCEKPLTTDVAAARRMIARAQERGLLLSMASKFRYVPDLIAARQMVAAGVIGRVALFENVFTGRVDMSQRWNSDPDISGGGVLIDNGTHSVDIARYLLGPIARVNAIEGARAPGLAVEDSAHLFLEWESGTRGHVDLSWRIHKPLPWFVALYGDLGMMELGWRESRYKLHAQSEWVKFGDGYDKVGAFRGQIDNVAAAIRGQEALLVDVDAALASVAAITAAYRSMASSGWEAAT